MTVSDIETIFNLDDTTYGAALALALPLVQAYVEYTCDSELAYMSTFQQSIADLVIGEACATLVRNYNISGEKMAELRADYVTANVAQVVAQHADVLNTIVGPVCY